MRDVVNGENCTRRRTRLLPRITPPGTACHTEPVQYCTVKSTTPNLRNVIVGVGSIGYFQLSCTENIAISSMVREPAKATCSQSGNPPAVASCQPPPLLQLSPRLSPLMAPAGAYPVLAVDDADAVAPFAEAATLTAGAEVEVITTDIWRDAVKPPPSVTVAVIV